MAAQSVPSRPEDIENLKSLIKQEIDEGIRTAVLPILDAHMKQFAESFQQLVAKEVSQLKQSVEAETAKMQSTVRVIHHIL